MLLTVDQADRLLVESLERSNVLEGVACYLERRRPAFTSSPQRVEPAVDFEPTNRCKDLQERLLALMDDRVYPAEPVYDE
jgi:hypothetical protein